MTRNIMAAKNSRDRRFEAALNYVKFEAMSGQAVQILSVLRGVKKEENQNSVGKKIKNLQG